jgi:ABC-type branched-subunit amino acid transport system substrate-binding protein
MAFLRNFQRLFLFLSIGFTVVACSRSIPVALMTKLASGSLVGVSEVGAAKIYKQDHPDSPMVVETFDDGWNPEKTKEAFKTVNSRGYQFLITSHTSSCAVAIADDIDRAGILTIITGATTNALTGKDDWIIRIVPDVEEEQKAVAHIVTTLPVHSILVLRDRDNGTYTGPAYATFSRSLGSLTGYTLRDFDISTVNPDLPGLTKILTQENYDLLYLLIGGYQSVAGNFAQLSFHIHPQSIILFSPWMHNPDLLSTAGPALAQGIIPSHFPPRSTSPAIDAYIKRVEGAFKVSPTYISLQVYQALELLDRAFKAGKRTPQEVKTWILGQGRFTLAFNSFEIDRFGDAHSQFYPIYHIEEEF